MSKPPIIPVLEQLRDVVKVTLESARIEWEHEVLKVQNGKLDMASLRRLDASRLDFMLLAAKLSGVELAIKTLRDSEEVA